MYVQFDKSVDDVIFRLSLRHLFFLSAVEKNYGA